MTGRAADGKSVAEKAAFNLVLAACKNIKSGYSYRDYKEMILFLDSAGAEEIVNTVSNDELVEKARGFLILVTDELWLLDIYFLGAITRILKRFSTQFQISGLTLDGYVNLVGQVKMALKNLKIVSPNAASQYFLVEYTEHLAKPLMVDPTQRASRSRLTDGQDAVDSRVSGLQERTHLHQKVVEGLLKWAKKYWFEHEYWQRQRNNVLRLENMGHIEHDQ
ncbi:uncharacterized protein LOC134821138 [Bolinopsis microptera]|uniref:uncharacterized protein LOC134821138 n=1 Tax=Bolinopsis microptera TaxID=2820187 RepID=UPI00307B045B